MRSTWLSHARSSAGVTAAMCCRRGSCPRSVARRTERSRRRRRQPRGDEQVRAMGHTGLREMQAAYSVLAARSLPAATPEADAGTRFNELPRRSSSPLELVGFRLWSRQLGSRQRSSPPQDRPVGHRADIDVEHAHSRAHTTAAPRLRAARPGRWATSRTAWAAKARARSVSAWRGSRTRVTPATIAEAERQRDVQPDARLRLVRRRRTRYRRRRWPSAPAPRSARAAAPRSADRVTTAGSPRSGSPARSCPAATDSAAIRMVRDASVMSGRSCRQEGQRVDAEVRRIERRDDALRRPRRAATAPRGCARTAGPGARRTRRTARGRAGGTDRARAPSATTATSPVLSRTRLPGG